MKKLLLVICLSIFTVYNFTFGSQINGRFVVISSDSTNYIVKLQLNTDTSNVDLGGATLIFNFNNSDLSINMENEIKVSPSSYVFHNFSGGNYVDATVTKPLKNQLWINIELDKDNNGTLLKKAPEWSDLVTIKFNTVNPSGNSVLQWQTDSKYLSVFHDNNTHRFSIGNFIDENTLPLSVNTETLPTEYKLFQNYPNPFNPTTTIKFSLPENSKVNISIYDILGRKLKTMTNKYFDAGYHYIDFNAADFTSGVYIYSIKTEKFSKVKKMILFK